MKLTALEDKTALVTGASSGLGADFARHLAGAGCHLVLVARREDALRALADDLRSRHGIRAEVVAADLSAPEGPADVFERTEGAGRPVDVLVNNAGFGLFGDFLDLPWERERNMLELDILSLVDLTKRFAKAMRSRHHGYILQVASIGAFQPSPSYATYSAAKSFVLNFGVALDYELRGTGVSCTVLSPGVTATEFLQVSGQTPTLYQRLAMMQSPVVTRIGLEAMVRRKPSVVPGLMNALTAFSTRFVSRRMAARAADILMR